LPETNRNLTLFIAEDSAILRMHLATILTEIRGMRVIGHADTTDKAIESILRLQPDVIILDIRMPGKGGIHVLQNIRQQLPAAIILIYTDYPFPQYRKKCLMDGADYFFDKATETELLIETIRQLAAGESPALSRNPMSTSPEDNS